MIANLVCLLRKQYELYPRLQIQDMVKLLYQNEFGPGHMVAAEANSYQRLQAECSDLNPRPSMPAFEDIGNGLCRLHLTALKDTGISLTTVNRFFVHTANSIAGNVGNFEKKLAVFVRCCHEQLLPFSEADATARIAAYREQGYPPVIHSDIYRETYSPAYRVMKAVFRDFFPLFCNLDRLLQTKDQVIVAIDGHCGAGKSTLANLLQAIYDCNVFHMDDFFLPAAMKTKERMQEPGGNVHYERFYQEVLALLSQNRPFRYRPFNCGSQSLEAEIAVTPKPLNIIEGAYSLHPALADAYDLKVFLEIDPEVQSQRILKRNGPTMHKRFISQWIPLENLYFQALKIKDQCDLVF
ncbi:MAG: hypothetical protein PHD92_09295 [Eubacteriales bacterium]|nr:hypothetical protein [Eubacteriales bacterium]